MSVTPFTLIFCLPKSSSVEDRRGYLPWTYLTRFLSFLIMLTQRGWGLGPLSSTAIGKMRTTISHRGGSMG